MSTYWQTDSRTRSCPATGYYSWSGLPLLLISPHESHIIGSSPQERCEWGRGARGNCCRGARGGLHDLPARNARRKRHIIFARYAVTAHLLSGWRRRLGDREAGARARLSQSQQGVLSHAQGERDIARPAGHRWDWLVRRAEADHGRATAAEAER